MENSVPQNAIKLITLTTIKRHQADHFNKYSTITALVLHCILLLRRDRGAAECGGPQQRHQADHGQPQHDHAPAPRGHEGLLLWPDGEPQGNRQGRAQQSGGEGPRHE